MRALVLVALLVLVPAGADAGGSRVYISGSMGTSTPPAPARPAYPAAPHGYPSYYVYGATCVAPGYWSRAFVPQTSTQNVWVPGQYSPDGIWIEGHYESQWVSGGYYQPVWVEPRSLC